MNLNMYKRGEVWNASWYVDGKRFRYSSKTSDKNEAREFFAKKYAKSFDVRGADKKVRRTWIEASTRYIDEHEHLKSIKNYRRHLEWWSGVFAKEKIVYLDQISPDVVKDIRDRELKRPLEHCKDRDRSPADVNHKLSFLRAVVNAACREYRWIEVAPLYRFLPHNGERRRWLTPTELNRLLQALPEPYSSMAQLAVATGLRQANVLGLKWEDVDLMNRTATFKDKVMKNGEPFSIPLNQTAMGVLRKQIGKHQEYVFRRKDGQRIYGVPSNVWNKAVEVAGLDNFHWHDLRHTWASLLRQSGKVDLSLLQELGGWKSAKMVQRYAHLSVEHLSSSADILDSVLSVSGQKPQLIHIQSNA
jgi:integrase